MPGLSVILITHNEEANIEACLRSVQWADEIVIVDSYSQDKTVSICRRFTEKCDQIRWMGFGQMKNAALDRATEEWVLSIDADERVTPELAREIRQAIEEAGNKVGFCVPRRAWFLGKWIRHCGWYPGHVLRLFRRDAGRFQEKRVHEGVLVQGSTGVLKHDLLHYTDRDLAHYFDKFHRYTTLAAQDLYQVGRRARPGDLILRPMAIFLKMYFIRAGFLDGLQGLILSGLSAGYVFTKYAKLWELEFKPHWKEVPR